MEYNSDHPLAFLLAVDSQYAPPWSPGPDPRTAHLPMMSNAAPILVASALYLALVLLGPVWMKGRPAWNVGRSMQVYNSVMTAVSLYMAIELPLAGYGKGLRAVCAPVGSDRTPADYRAGRVVWLYFFTKVVEFADTVFMVVRKKNSQITFLHVYHHVSVAITWWIVARWLPGGSSCFEPIINCVVHVLMYGYYFLASFGDRFKKFLWWKCYLTQFQIVQFVFLVSHTTVVYVLDCGYPRGMAAFVALYMLSFLVLFLAFYRRTYKEPSKKA